MWELGPRRDGVDEPNRGPAPRSSVRGVEGEPREPMANCAAGIMFQDHEKVAPVSEKNTLKQEVRLQI